MVYNALLLLVPLVLSLGFLVPAAVVESLQYFSRRAASRRETRYFSRRYRDPSRRIY